MPLGRPTVDASTKTQTEPMGRSIRGWSGEMFGKSWDIKSKSTMAIRMNIDSNQTSGLPLFAYCCMQNDLLGHQVACRLYRVARQEKEHQ